MAGNNNNLIPPKPGEIRNPWGKRGKDGLQGNPTSKSLKKLLEEKLDEIDPVTGKSQAELIIDRLIIQAKRGEGRFIELAFDRTLGKAPQYIEQNITGDGLGVIIIPNKLDEENNINEQSTESATGEENQ